MDYIDAADVVLFSHDRQRVLHVLTITRRWDPFAGRLALPGGHVDPGEMPVGAASRELYEETSLRVRASKLTTVGVYDKPGRDPRSNHYRSFAYTLLVKDLPAPIAADDAATAQWTPVAAIRADARSMAFDHRQIVLDAAAKLDLIRHA